MKKVLRWLEQLWQCIHDEASQTLYRAHLKAYEVVVRAANKTYFSAFIASVISHLTYLFRVVHNLTSLTVRH